MAVAGDDAVSIEKDRVVLDVPGERAPDVTRALVLQGVDVHEVTTVGRTLEEVFFEMTARRELEMEVSR